ncbi:hypothetical protein ACIPC1_33410 [Streptomyces sp. NPDC087263]|uniref:hypothetical protein n=1 Tax=Streptomyces sp. NPDC087263 TaxID=3365773 RepID=UPI0037FE63A7
MNPPRLPPTSPPPRTPAWQHPGPAQRGLAPQSGLGPSLSEGVRVRVLRAAHGDRHAAAELASLLTERQLTGLDPLPARPPALLRAYRQEVRALPDSTRFLLLLAAADQHPVATHAYLRAVTAARLDTRHLDAAEAAGLAHATADGIVFRDQWTRIAAYETVRPSDRREVHQLLARVLRGEGEEPRRAWHHGAAALGPSRRLAARLRVAADLARAAREHALACALLERAAALAPDPRDRAHLLARAATDAWHSGDTDRARRLAAPPPTTRSAACWPCARVTRRTRSTHSSRRRSAAGGRGRAGPPGPPGPPAARALVQRAGTQSMLVRLSGVLVVSRRRLPSGPPVRALAQ